MKEILIIILSNFLFYAKTLCFKYVSDDIPSSQRPKHPNKWMHFLLSLEGHLKTNTYLDHFITLVLHTTVCVFIYLAFGSNNISFLAAILFAFNPINNQGAVWISGRGYVLSTLGMTGALAFPKLALAFLVLATYSNAGFLAPICLIGSNYSYLLLFMPLIWLFHMRRFKRNVADKMKTETYVEDKRIHIGKLIVLIKTASFYFVHSIIPIRTAFYHSYLQSMTASGRAKAYSLVDRFLWIGVGILGFIIWRFITHPWDLVNFGFLWYMITIAPFCNVIRLQQEIAERYAYLPNVGLMIVLATYLQAYPILIPAVIAMYATKMWFYMDCYEDDYYLVETSCLNAPDAWFGWHVRAMRRWEQKSYQEAVILWTMAKIISPNEFKVLFNISTALKLSQLHQEADEYLKLAMENVPEGQEEQSKQLYEDWKKGNLTILL